MISAASSGLPSQNILGSLRTVVKAVLGECIWKLSFNEQRMAIELELTNYLEEEDADMLVNQFPVPADYDSIGSKGTKFVFYV